MIEFRLWDKQEKKMLYYDQDVVPKMTLNGVLVDEKDSNVSNRYVIMESLGWNDYKGKKIYVGDIVEFYSGYYKNCINNRGYVHFTEDGLQYWVSLFFPKGVESCGGDEFLVLHGHDDWGDEENEIGANECEVIGHVFENEEYKEYTQQI